MSTPVDIKKRDAALQERKKQEKPPKSPKKNLAAGGDTRRPPSNPGGGGASSSRAVQAPSDRNRRRPRSEGYVDDADYSNFTWDDWVGRPLPPLIHFAEIPIGPRNLLPFHGRDHFLSTFYPARFVIEGHQYYSVEGYYEAVKIFCNIDVAAAQKLSHIISAAEAKKVARNLLREKRIPRAQIDMWKETQGVRALYNAITAKFTQNEALREKLKATKDKLLVHSYPSDNVYASGCTEDKLRAWAERFAGKAIKIPLYQDLTNIQEYLTPTGAGKNILGYITMRVRAELNAYDTSTDVFARLSVN
uniref:NADAR domain-containing protein n=1 Tax=Panagrellus redivivus TaxID=6233 RepID=A0A7E4V5M3_PANRE